MTQKRWRKYWSVGKNWFREGADWIDGASKWLVAFTAVIFLLTYCSARRESQVSDAWSRLYTATGQGGDGGRVWALETLHGHDGILLNVNLNNAFLQGLNAPGIVLSRSRLRNCQLDFCVLTGAGLNMCDCTGARFFGCDLTSAFLGDTIFERASIGDCDLRGADLRGARFAQTTIDTTDLRGAKGFGLLDLLSCGWREKTLLPEPLEAFLALPSVREIIPRSGLAFGYRRPRRLVKVLQQLEGRRWSAISDVLGNRIGEGRLEDGRRTREMVFYYPSGPESEEWQAHEISVVLAVKDSLVVEAWSFPSSLKLWLE